MDSFENVIKGKRVLIFGVGTQGGGSGDRAWLEAHGAKVRLSDRNLEICKEGQTKEQIDWAEIIIKNPGVADDHELILYAKSLEVPVYTSIAIFVKYSNTITIAVTGTRGKSTTVALISELLNKAYPGDVIVGGNIPGTSGLGLLDLSIGKKYSVLELSSFQLHNFHDFKISPNISIITNIYPDHLNRYRDMQSYIYDKEAICMYQTPSDYCLFNQGNPGATSIGAKSPGQKIKYSGSDLQDVKTSLPGAHNKENLSAMFCLAKVLGIDPKLPYLVAESFRGLPYRQEVIRNIEGVKYVNDTTSTTPIAALTALKATDSPTIWITGGDTKNLPYSELLEEVKANPNLKQVIILGSKNIPDYVAQLKELLGKKVVGTVDSMKSAVDLARELASHGDTVLLSPGFASFDLFQNEFDRGRQFNALVEKL